MLLHLPIGFLIAWTIMETVSLARPALNLRPACGLLLWLTVLSAIPAAIAGTLLASAGGYDATLLFRHRLFGSATVIICIWLIVVRTISGVGSGKKRFSPVYHGLIFINLIILSLAGHLGGSLTHGSNYLTKYMPPGMKSILGLGETAIVQHAEKTPIENIAKPNPSVAKYKNEIHVVLTQHLL